MVTFVVSAHRYFMCEQLFNDQIVTVQACQVVR
jgi:hypothetical protein